MKVLCFHPERGLLTGGPELLDQPGARWIDLEAPTEASFEPLIPCFQLHRLAVEDCLHLDQRPKLEEYPGHQFIVLQGFSCPAGGATDLRLEELHLFLGPDWVITVHEHPLEAVTSMWQRAQAEPAQMLGRGADFVACGVADALVDGNFPVLDALHDDVETLEGDIFERPAQAHLGQVFALRRTLAKVRRVLSPQRDVVGQLSRPGTPHVQDRTALYFRNVYDHLVRLYESIDSERDLLSNVLEGYLSSMANRTNEVTKQLTIFATIFLPLSFITGFFGQNFAELSTPEYFRLMLALVVGLPLTLLWWFRKKDWL